MKAKTGRAFIEGAPDRTMEMWTTNPWWNGASYLRGRPAKMKVFLRFYGTLPVSVRLVTQQRLLAKAP